jgi:predicted phage terminase large subunit-like protein
LSLNGLVDFSPDSDPSSSDPSRPPLNPRPTLSQFIDLAWPTIEPATRFIGGFHVDAIVHHLEAISRGELRNLIINVPPRHSKSSLVSVLWPVWEWIDDPWLRWLFVSYGQDLSTRDSVKRRRLIESDWFRAQWGDRFMLASDQNQKTRYENSRTGVMIASSAGGTGTGEGGHRIVVDDPHKADEVESDVQRRAVLDWWDGTMSTRANQEQTARVIVMQRLHENDLTGHVLDQMKAGGEQYDHLVLPAEYEPRVYLCPANLEHDCRTEEGDLLSPARFDAAAIARLKVSLGDRAAGQLQQLPAPAGGAIFRKDVWEDGQNRYEVADPALASRIIGRYLSYDTAFKDTESSDFTGLTVWDMLADNTVLLRQVRNDRLEMPQLLATVRADVDRHDAAGTLRGIIMEEAGSGISALQILRAGLPPKYASLLRPFKPGGASKVARARAVTQWCALGLVKLPHPSEAVPWLDAFAGPEGKLWKFPTVEHDDDIDSFVQALLFFTPWLHQAMLRNGGLAA